jgi:hypothetical protein
MGGQVMQPFEVAPGWRINQLDRQFTLEYLQKPKKGGTEASWRITGYFGKITHAIEAWVSEAIRESDKALPETLADVRVQVEAIMTHIVGQELKAAGEPE